MEDFSFSLYLLPLNMNLYFLATLTPTYVTLGIVIEVAMKYK